MTGDIKLQDLVISKLLGQGLDKYKSLFPHVSAAIQLAIEGKSTPVGEGVEYVFTNSHHTNPLNRVTPRELIKERQNLEYDNEKYRKMVLEAAETVLGFIGFDRTTYGDVPKRKNREWWAGLKEERLRDRNNERI